MIDNRLSLRYCSDESSYQRTDGVPAVVDANCVKGKGVMRFPKHW